MLKLRELYEQVHASIVLLHIVVVAVAVEDFNLELDEDDHHTYRDLQIEILFYEKEALEQFVLVLIDHVFVSKVAHLTLIGFVKPHLSETKLILEVKVGNEGLLD